MRKAVIVTGASNGIGRATVERLAADGYLAINLDIAAAPTAGAHIVNHRVDLADEAATRELLSDIVAEHEVAGLVNNAGHAYTATLEETSTELLEKTWAVNLRAATLCAQMVVPGMKARRFGRIVNIASSAALGRRLRTAYAGSKGALISMTKVWALELGSHGITVNAIGPGPVATELWRRMNPADSEEVQRRIANVPVGRVGEPADIANAIAFFMDPRAGYVTGQALYVCGGMSIGSAAI
ncbi:MAG: SDR family NAD(P)-dependent oxidoreductase [Hyphomicrobiaceae bacterium]